MNCPKHFYGHWTSHVLRNVFNNLQRVKPTADAAAAEWNRSDSVWGNFTFESLLVVSRLQSRAELLQVLVLSTVHDKEEPPEHVAGQGSIRHLRHKQPDSQPVGFEEAARNSSTLINPNIWKGDISGPPLCCVTEWGMWGCVLAPQILSQPHYELTKTSELLSDVTTHRIIPPHLDATNALKNPTYFNLVKPLSM